MVSVDLLFSSYLNTKELKQRRFWAGQVNRKWTSCILGLCFRPNYRANRLYMSKDTLQYKFSGVRAYQKRKDLTYGWREWLKTPFLISLLSRLLVVRLFSVLKSAQSQLGSHAGGFRGARVSSLPTNAVCGERRNTSTPKIACVGGQIPASAIANNETSRLRSSPAWVTRGATLKECRPLLSLLTTIACIADTLNPNDLNDTWAGFNAGYPLYVFSLMPV